MKVRYYLYMMGVIFGVFGLGATEQNDWQIATPLMIVGLVFMGASICVPLDKFIKI